MSEFRDYIEEAGWQLCAIRTGSKSPDYPQWNVRPIALDAADGLDGAGLLHALSKTACLDVDDIDAARPWLLDKGVDLDSLLNADDAVRIESGRPGRTKLLFRMSRPLRTFKPKGSGLELRCATATGASVQDVLPNSIHPQTGKPYRWVFGIMGDWRSPPTIPAALLNVWRSLDTEDESPLPPVDAPRSIIDVSQLRKAAFKHSPDAEYDEWLRVGMQLHQGTNGAQEGFDIWCEWSKNIKRAPYPGDASLKTHWLSFTTTGKHVATGDSLIKELPADAEEFPIESAAPAEKQTASEMRKAALEELEKRLVFVHSAERYFDLERHKLISSDNVLEHMFTHLMPVKKANRISPIKMLKESRTKRFVDAVGFHPGEESIFHSGNDSFANTYFKRLPEPLEPTDEEIERIEWLFNRIDDRKYRDWLLQFYAHVIQWPGVKIKSAPLIWSETQGNGKTTLLRMIPMLLVGPRYSREVTSSQLSDMFNGYLLDAWHINLTEFRAGSRGEREAISKKVESWIADDAVAVRPMHQTAYTMPNHFFITGSSNSEDAAAIGNSDRKWAVHELHAPQFTEAEQQWMYNEFLLTPRAAGVLRHYFLNISLKGFVASAKALDTEARREMVEASRTSDMELLHTAWEQRTEPFNCDVALINAVADFVRRNSMAKPSDHRVGRLLCRQPFNGKPIELLQGSSKYQCVTLRNHTQAADASNGDILSTISVNTVDLAT